MRSSLVVVLTTLALAACKKPEPPPPASAPIGAAETPKESVKGKVLERIDAAPYSYLRLSTGAGETWVAVPQTTSATGADITVVNAMPMDGFESKTLNRKFDHIYFGMLAGQAGAPGGMGQGTMAGGAAKGAAMPAGGPMAPGAPSHDGQMPPMGMAQQHAAAAAGPTDIGDVKVPKATGAEARTVAEVFAQKGALKEKKVAVRGKVVKFSPGIMGRNWVHIRDGSGAAAKGDHDLTVTTSDNVAVGDVVTAKGTVRTDKDFGAGYAYPVIVEEAQVAK